MIISLFFYISIIIASWFIYRGLETIVPSYSLYNVLPIFAIVFVVYFVIGYIFYYVDIKRNPDWLHKKKYQADISLSKEEYDKTFKTMVIKMMFIILPTFLITFIIMQWRINSYPNVIAWMQKNGVIGFLICLLVVYVIADMTAWFVHKMLHQGILWENIHKHHHSYISTVAIASLDAHPIEVIFWDAFPFIFGSLLLGTSPAFFSMFAILSISNTALCHSGYDIGYDHGHHDLHHERLKCNYSGMLSDKLMGTYIKRDNKIYPRYDGFQKDLFGSKNIEYNVVTDSMNRAYARA